MPAVMTQPNQNEWKLTENKFHHRCMFPSSVGATDGKHIILQAPANSGSLFYSYKILFSIVAMAIVSSF